MPILDLQRRIREIGRIRIGDTVEATSKSGKKIRRPVKLETFKLTSRDEQVIRAAAELFGGTAEPWPEMEGQWQTTTSTAVLDVIVPPSDMSFSQWYELWSGGGCKKRCDGVRDMLRDCPCDCDPTARECSIHTRLSVILPELPGLGVWRVDTQGYYAAVEIGGAVEVAISAASRGQMLPARLRLEQRKVLRDGMTKQFAVPVLDLDVAPAALLAPGGGGAIGVGAPVRDMSISMFDPVPEQAAIGSVPSIREQAEAPVQPPKRRANAAATIPATGVKPRSVAQVGDKVCSRCGDAWGESPLVKGSEGESRYVHRECPGLEAPATPEPVTSEIVEAELAPEPAPMPPAEPESSASKITDAQSKKLHALLRSKFGNVTGPNRFPVLSAALGRPIESTKDLSKADASAVIDQFEQLPDGDNSDALLNGGDVDDAF